MPLMISGARYSSVPTKELARPCGSAFSVNILASARAPPSVLCLLPPYRCDCAGNGTSTRSTRGPFVIYKALHSRGAPTATPQSA